MLRAAETGDLASVEAAIAAGVDVLSKDGAKNTAVRRRVLCMRRWPAPRSTLVGFTACACTRAAAPRRISRPP